MDYFVQVSHWMTEKRKKTDNLKAISLFWSEWRDLNSRPLAPQSSALPTAPHPAILFRLSFSNSTNAIITQKPEMSSNFSKKSKVFYFWCFFVFYVIIAFVELRNPTKIEYPGVAQLGARLTGGQEAVSSSLATRTILKKAEIVDIQRFQLFTFL